MGLPGQIAAEKVIANFKLSEREAQTPDRFTRLIRRLGVGGRETEIRRCFNLVCEESLRPAAGWSSLNADGTPVQFALSLAKGRRPGFEFVGEAFRSGMEYVARRAFGLECMTRLASMIGVQSYLGAVQQHLAVLTDAGTAGDCEDPAGAFWIGSAFEPAGTASMMIYANARRGQEAARWKRLAEFAASVVEADWPRIFAVAEASAFKPLGTGVRISTQHRPHARIYFGAYGVKPEEYRRVFREAGAGEPFDRALAVFFDEMLGADAVFPTRSAVFSFGSNGDGEWSPKLELCGHCAWSTDKETEARCTRWLARLGMDVDLYRDVVAVLTRKRESASTCVHAYMGVGMRHDQPYASIYLNPGRDVL